MTLAMTEDQDKKKILKKGDTLSHVTIPTVAYYGANTQRAVENFPISGIAIPLPMIKTIALLKKNAAIVNSELGMLEQRIADAVVMAAQEIVEGNFDDNFPVDVFQTGSATSTNMNVNEVIASRAKEIITGEKKSKPSCSSQ